MFPGRRCRVKPRHWSTVVPRGTSAANLTGDKIPRQDPKPAGVTLRAIQPRELARAVQHRSLARPRVPQGGAGRHRHGGRSGLALRHPACPSALVLRASLRIGPGIQGRDRGLAAGGRLAPAQCPAVTSVALRFPDGRLVRVGDQAGSALAAQRMRGPLAARGAILGLIPPLARVALPTVAGVAPASTGATRSWAPAGAMPRSTRCTNPDPPRRLRTWVSADPSGGRASLR